MEQGTAEWHAMRCGRVTASRIGDIMARTKTGWGASRANYMAELIAERLTGVPAESFTSAAMQHGIDTEAEARMAYEFHADCDVEHVGFLVHPQLVQAGASPDGLVGDDGMVEIKCPNTATHIETLLGASIPRKYLLQMHWQMECAGRRWCDFVSYDPRMPEALRLHVQRVEQDDAMTAEIVDAVREFLDETRSKEMNLRNLYEPEPNAARLLRAG